MDKEIRRREMKPDYEKMFKQLLMMNQGGVYLQLDDGHTWIMKDSDADHPLSAILCDAGVSVANKIYGGIAQALDTMDEAALLAGCGTLCKQYDVLVRDFYFIGEGGVREGWVEKVAAGEGGLV
jgi:hypothetical protein